MNHNYRFNYRDMAEHTKHMRMARFYNSWERVCRVLAARGFNAWEAEAILCSNEWSTIDVKPSNIINRAYICFHVHEDLNRLASSSCVSKYLDKNDITPGCNGINKLVLKTFPDLIPNERGVPCRGGRTLVGQNEILVPVGTPLCCDPTSETYWSM